MSSASKAVGPISMALLFVGILATLALTFFMPVAELIPAQVMPAPRTSGESPVRSEIAMSELAKVGLQMLQMLPRQEEATGEKEFASEAAAPLDKKAIVDQWEAKIIKENGKDYGQQLINSIEQSLGGRDNVEYVVQLVQTNKNFVYYAYALFLGLAMFAAALAIQAIGRYDAEEKTVLPVKK
ncbi:MAG: hypothetical protein K2W82_19025 [Candidatus Obscuribacterales bacterium]|nr:hypothetical protein [Candidatus Obscuribacterales bacterium]